MEVIDYFRAITMLKLRAKLRYLFMSRLTFFTVHQRLISRYYSLAKHYTVLQSSDCQCRLSPIVVVCTDEIVHRQCKFWLIML